jgi:hypothetical protein
MTVTKRITQTALAAPAEVVHARHARLSRRRQAGGFVLHYLMPVTAPPKAT